jgi:hypothetical protein
MEEEQRSLQQQLEDALANPDVLSIYFNGFVATVAVGDIAILLKRAGKDIAVLHVSYTVAKTLAEKLGTSIATFEQAMGNTIMTTDYIKKKVEETHDAEMAE